MRNNDGKITDISIGFCKRRKTGAFGVFGVEGFVYTTQKINKKTQLYTYVSNRHLTFTSEKKFREADDYGLFAYLLLALKEAGAEIKSATHDLKQLAIAHPTLFKTSLDRLGAQHPLAQAQLKLAFYYLFHGKTGDAFWQIFEKNPKLLHSSYTLKHVVDQSFACVFDEVSIFQMMVFQRCDQWALKVQKIVEQSDKLDPTEKTALLTDMQKQFKALYYPAYFISGQLEFTNRVERKELEQVIFP